MADSFIGEIRIFTYTYAPYQWAQCSGQQVPINQNNVLYAVIGATFGGDGNTYFNLPNLQGQVPMGTGQGPGLTPCFIGEAVGTESVTLATGEMAAHTHTVTAKTVLAAAANMTGTPATDSWLSRTVNVSGTTATGFSSYTPSGTPDVTLAAQTLGAAGGDTSKSNSPTVAHENRQPYLPMLFCISLYGNFPPRPS